MKVIIVLLIITSFILGIITGVTLYLGQGGVSVLALVAGAITAMLGSTIHE